MNDGKSTSDHMNVWTNGAAEWWRGSIGETGRQWPFSQKRWRKKFRQNTEPTKHRTVLDEEMPLFDD